MSSPQHYSYDKAGNLVFQRQDQPNDPPAAPLIVGISGPRIVPAGSTVTLSVVVADAHGATFQWRFNGADMPGETKDSLVLTNFTAAMEGPYTVIVSNSVASVAAMVSVWLDSTGNLLPDTWQIAHFGNLTSQRAAGDPDQDGIANLDEFLDDTDPLSNTSQRPRLVAYSDVGGLVAAAPTQLSYGLGDTVTLTATPFPPYVFDGWDGDLQGTTNPAQLQMTGSKKVRAKMRKP
jgi:hypothetical protein